MKSGRKALLREFVTFFLPPVVNLRGASISLRPSLTSQSTERKLPDRGGRGACVGRRAAPPPPLAGGLDTGERGTQRQAAGGEGAGRGLQLSYRRGAERALLRPEPSAAPKKRAGERAKGAIEAARQAGRRPGPAPARALAPSPARSGWVRSRAPSAPVRPGESGLRRGRRAGGREENGRGRGRERSPSRGRGR